MKDNSIHFFNSLEEMSDEHFKYLASLSPEEHLRNAVLHIQQIYAEELKRINEGPKGNQF